MTLSILLRVMGIALVALSVVFKPRWLRGQSAEQALSTHDALAGEHGLDRFAYVLIFALAYGFLIFLAYKMTPLFREGEVLFWSLIVGALLAVAAVRFWPKKRQMWEWHDQE
jgi:DMSO reductase anchor subunit